MTEKYPLVTQVEPNKGYSHTPLYKYKEHLPTYYYYIVMGTHFVSKKGQPLHIHVHTVVHIYNGQNVILYEKMGHTAISTEMPFFYIVG